MKLTLGALRRMVHEAWAGSHPEESYDDELIDDEAYKKRSTYVPNDIKRSINKWMIDMGLSHAKKKRLR